MMKVEIKTYSNENEFYIFYHNFYPELPRFILTFDIGTPASYYVT